MKLNEKLFESTFNKDVARNELTDILDTNGVLYEDTGWDYYDNSLELYGVPPSFRLSDSMLRTLLDECGFAVIYVNHTDEWETHYSRHSPNGWRVSYPHKRKMKNDPTIWLEK